MAAVVHNKKETTLELYYRANTSVLGGVALVVADFNKPFNVQGYDPSLGKRPTKLLLEQLVFVIPSVGAC